MSSFRRRDSMVQISTTLVPNLFFNALFLLISIFAFVGKLFAPSRQTTIRSRLSTYLANSAAFEGEEGGPAVALEGEDGRPAAALDGKDGGHPAAFEVVDGGPAVALEGEDGGPLERAEGGPEAGQEVGEGRGDGSRFREDDLS